jgi:hypothetical protein
LVFLGRSFKPTQAYRRRLHKFQRRGGDVLPDFHDMAEFLIFFW